jgi:hypothetical protein
MGLGSRFSQGRNKLLVSDLPKLLVMAVMATGTTGHSLRLATFNSDDAVSGCNKIGRTSDQAILRKTLFFEDILRRRGPGPERARQTWDCAWRDSGVGKELDGG